MHEAPISISAFVTLSDRVFAYRMTNHIQERVELEAIVHARQSKRILVLGVRD